MIRSIFEKLRNSPTGIIAAGSRFLSIGAMFGTAAIAGRVLDGDRFGLWSVLLTIPLLTGLASLGINGGAGNRLAASLAAAGNSETAKVRRFFCSTFYAQLLPCLCLGLLACAVVSLLDWSQLLRIEDSSLKQEAGGIIAVTVGLALAAVPFQNSYGSVLAAFHRVQVVAILMAVQNIILFVFAVCTLGNLRFEDLVFGYFLLNLILVVAFFIFTLRSIGWHLEWIGLGEINAHISSIFRPSAEFWVLNLSATLIAAGQTGLVALAGGVAVAGPFSLLQRLFSLLVTLHMAFISPLMPVYTQRAVRGEWEWLGTHNRKVSIFVTPLAVLGVGIPLMALHPWILKLWTGIPFQNYTLAILLLVWATLGAVGNSFSLLLNGLGHFRPQAVLGVFTASVFLAVFWLLHLRFGVASIPIATVVSSAVGIVVLQGLVHSVCREQKLSV